MSRWEMNKQKFPESIQWAFPLRPPVAIKVDAMLRNQTEYLPLTPSEETLSRISPTK